ncbi:hypothetical protein D1614_08005 [Maribellus luteus]|uniref:KAP NTPase domain-containing protein n=1 Tax=Maribellus luteus TaxID=2305463 RepID=A0A399T6E7_9BACT|nr:P-loop NTPase fold protein [Maribellus luteus]RIJ49473.1 hypothetical protein D1614_08005 [Maribellus luteus]
MTDKPLVIPIDKIKSDFQTFLTPHHNRRIIFSGAFGIGKTHFLNEFFKEKEEYFPVFLRPINYSLLSNEDVFKFIKYDILAQLIQNEKFEVGDSFDFSAEEYTKYYVGQNGFSILFNLLKYAPKVGAFIKASEKLGILVEKFRNGLKEINSNAELKMLKEFGEQAENHFLYENDGVTDFISEILNKLVTPENQEDGNKSKVLIIDDLDRLDPEHIFRLFNVFSAHFDQVHYYENKEGNDNKFGFDKIIFVCDIENIRKIFAHKYGSEVDFSGYIDKFYSTTIYRFLHNDVFDQIVKPHFENKLELYHDFRSYIRIGELFVAVLKLLFQGHELSVREIKKLNSYKPSFISENKIVNYSPVMLTKVGSKENSVLKQYKLLIICKIFEETFGTRNIFLKKINRAFENFSKSDDSDLNYTYAESLGDIILFSDIDHHKFNYSKINDASPLEFELKTNKGVVLKYKILGGYYSNRYEGGDMWFRAEIEKPFNTNISNGQFYKLLVSALENIVKYGI